MVHTFAIIKALSKSYPLEYNTSCTNYKDYAYLTVSSFGGLYGIKISHNQIESQLLTILYDGGSDTKNKTKVITNQFQLSVLLELFRAGWKDNYNVLFKNIRHREYILNRIKIDEVLEDLENCDTDIYLALFPMLGYTNDDFRAKLGSETFKVHFESGNTLKIKGYNICTDFSCWGRRVYSSIRLLDFY